MPDISKEAVEREICNPIISYVSEGRGMSEATLAGIIDKARAMLNRIDHLEDREISQIAQARADALDEACAIITDWFNGAPTKIVDQIKALKVAKGCGGRGPDVTAKERYGISHIDTKEPKS